MKNLIILATLIIATSCKQASTEKKDEKTQLNTAADNSASNSSSLASNSKTRALSSNTLVQSAPEGMGFYNVASDSVPSLVQEASKSVFRLAVPAGNKITVSQMFNGKTTEDAIAFINNLDGSKISKSDRLIYLFQLQQCLKNSTQVCTLFEGIEQGTGFLVDDGSKMYTAYHVIKSVATSQKLPIFIIGSNDEVIFSPNDISITVHSIGSPNATAGLNPNVQSKVQDIVLLQLSMKMGEPLKQAVDSLQSGSKVYMVGFPMPTTDRKKFGALESDGVSKYVSQGHILSFEEVKNIAQKKFGGVQDILLNELITNLVISSADGAPGLSGAPTLNENGEYIGVYTSGAPQYEASVDRLSYSTPVR